MDTEPAHPPPIEKTMVPEMAPGMTPEMVLEVVLDTGRKEGPTLDSKFLQEIGQPYTPAT